MAWIEGDGLTPTNLNNKVPSGFAVSVTDPAYGPSVGDDSTDNATDLQSAFDAIPTGGGTVVFTGAGTYRSSDALTLKAGTVVDLNGSTLKFTVTGAENCLLLRNNCQVINGTVELAGSGYSGHGGNGCPITIGDYNTGTGYSNIVVRDVTVVSNKDNGNGIIVTGASHNVVIENIKAATSTSLGRVVLVHWGNADDPTAGTEHPYDVTIRNIQCGDLTYNDVDVSPVLLSGCYNIIVENVTAGDITNGRAMLVYAGDYGSQYADAEVQRRFLKNIIVRNYAVESSLVGFRTNYKNISGTVTVHDGDVVFECCNVTGNAPTSSSCIGVDLTNSVGVAFEHSTIQSFNKGFAFEATVRRTAIVHCSITSIYAQALNTGTTSTPNFLDVVVRHSLFSGNNQQGTASRGDIVLNNAARWDISGNRFNSVQNTFGIRALSTSSDLWIYNNSVSSLTAGGTAYSLGASTDLPMGYGANNVASTGITLHGGTNLPWSAKGFMALDGSAVAPTYAMSSESSLGLFRSAASVLKQSYGWLAADFISSSTTNQSLATAKMPNQGQLAFSILSLTSNGAEFGVRSGNTIYRWFSDAVG